MGSKNDPGQFDCYVSAMPDEPMFILLARDPLAPELVEQWAGRRILGNEPDKAAEAHACAADMRAWRDENEGAWRGREIVPAEKQWRCFHCDDVFVTAADAAEHFGEGNYEAEMPLCIEAATSEMKALVLTNREMFERLMKVEADLEQAEHERDCWAEAGRSATGNPTAGWHDLRGNMKIDELEGRTLAVEAALDAAPRWLANFLRHRAERLWHRRQSA